MRIVAATLAISLLLIGAAGAQDKGTLDPKPLPPL
ncbi:MAG: penicillin-insensitive murein endopeptidase, partial [Methylobacteriaceae bacterium]|nr:penicillin-insensitive murein endopeptidase [Methylobacteriaceae bacterium]